MSRACALLASATVLLSPCAAGADCECLCLDGRFQPICDNPSDQPHACAPTACSSPNGEAAQKPDATSPAGIATCAPKLVEDPETINANGG